MVAVVEAQFRPPPSLVTLLPVRMMSVSFRSVEVTLIPPPLPETFPPVIFIPDTLTTAPVMLSTRLVVEAAAVFCTVSRPDPGPMIEILEVIAS